MFLGATRLPPVDPSGVTIFRLHREPEADIYVLELPGRHDEEGESYDLDTDKIEWWLDRMLGAFDHPHAESRRNKIVDYAHEFHHLEYEFPMDRLVPLPNFPDPELHEIQAFQEAEKQRYLDDTQRTEDTPSTSG